MTVVFHNVFDGFTTVLHRGLVMAAVITAAPVLAVTDLANEETKPVHLQKSNSSAVYTNSDNVIWYEKAGSDWEKHSLPIGNGALGATILGAVETDYIQFSEKTLWTGGPGAKEGYDFGLPAQGSHYPQLLEQIQQQLWQQKKLAPKAVADVLGRPNPGYGSYQSFADIQMQFAHPQGDVKNYRRTLDMNRAVVSVSYSINNVDYSREYFVSYPDNTIVIKVSANHAASINVDLGFALPTNRSVNWANTEQGLRVSGVLHDNGLGYAAGMQVHANNGEINHTQNQQMSVKNADTVWITVAANTDYAQQYPKYRGTAPLPKVDATLKKIADLSYQQLLNNHLQDYQSLFSRVELNINQADNNLATDKLLSGYHSINSEQQNRTLEALYYQFGRYLLISSSRAGSLPANLQGVWNKHEYAPWSADYHVNINLQMNYWLADMTNLSETLPPLFDFVDSLVEPGTQTAKRLFNAPGWTLLLNTNIWGFTGLIAWPTAFWQPEAAAWMAQHYYEHYRFSLDQNFLEQRAYPIMKSATEFWLYNLKVDPQFGSRVVNPSYSPEHGEFTVAAAMSQQIVFDLLSNTLFSAKLLSDNDMVKRIQPVLAELDPGLRIGSWGQLQEWREDIDDKTSQHRHISQLYALHPANHISPLSTPKLAEAAKVTLNARGDGGTGWSKAWKVNFWARLFDGDRALKLLSEQLLHSTLSNLWDNHPPFQIDGNFGGTAGMTEMLLQSQHNDIHLLPALPSKWPQGHVKGLKARGNVQVDMQWHNNRLTQATLRSQSAQTLHVRNSSLTNNSKLVDQNGKTVEFTLDDQVLKFKTKSNMRYTIINSS
ncbi:glycoside hydrolase family 95 protein [Alteromonadaceae bacterium BrNp21-10]|nr:glycoside hydrolase family 95 protein [Alteromonadaceae bacterium BrNp21-10]